jgi:hypothetical protein
MLHRLQYRALTPDRLSGGDTGDRPPRTQPCQGTPDTAVSPDPPPNHHRTADARPRGARPAAGVAGGGAGEFFAALGDAWRLTQAQRARLAPAVTAALDAGWTPQGLAAATGANTSGVRNPYAVLAARLSDAELPPPTRLPRPAWCGECDQATRMLDFDSDAPRPCPRCKRVPPPAAPSGLSSGRSARATARTAVTECESR